MSRDTIPDRIRRNGRSRGDQPAFYFDGGQGWRPTTWAEYAEQAMAFAGALVALDYRPGQGVAIVSNNRPEWIIAASGAMCARAVPAGIYQTLTAEQVAYVADHCEAKVVVVEDREQWAKIDAERSNLPHLERIVMLKEADGVDDPTVRSFAAFLDEGRQHQDAAEARFAELQDDDLATLIYTSGTTGPPKGVMLTHHAVAWTAQTAAKVVVGDPDDDCMVSYLPLSHIAEQMFSVHLPATVGYPIWITDAFEKLKDTLVAARPTLFMGVPRVWEKFKGALEKKLAEATGLKAGIIGWARGVGERAADDVVTRGAPSGLLGLQYGLADKLFYSKLKQQLGLDRLRVAVTGAAPIGKDVLAFFQSLGILIHEVYGQSEDCGPTTFNQPHPGKRKPGTVGLPFPGVDVKIADDGEILVRGPNVFTGYYKNPEATAETLSPDGWLHSGDIGSFDEDGFLRITDRKKDLIITAGGKNVAPQNIEKLLKAIPGVGQAVVIGDQRKFLAALLTVDAEAGPAVAAERGWPTDPAALVDHPAFRDHVQKGVDQANAALARYEQIKRWRLLPEDFSVEGGELTPTQKVKRRVVNDKHADAIAALYAGVS